MTNYQVERLIRELDSPHLDNLAEPSGIPAPEQPRPLNSPWREAAGRSREMYLEWRRERWWQRDEEQLRLVLVRREAKKAVTAERRREKDRERKRMEAERAAAAQGKDYVFKPRRSLKGLSPQELADYKREQERVKKARQRSASSNALSTHPLYSRYA